MANNRVADQFIGTDVESSQSVKSEVVFETVLLSRTNERKSDFWKRLNNAVATISAQMAAEKAAREPRTSIKAQTTKREDGVKVLIRKDGEWHSFTCEFAADTEGHAKLNWRRPGDARRVCKPCLRTRC